MQTGRFFMGHHKSIFWMGLLFVLFTPVSQAVEIQATKFLSSHNSEETIPQSIDPEQTLEWQSGFSPCHRGSGRRCAAH
ncbi:MAG TPA: hypothetical protein V6D28_17130 [Leptolyngbyaceae cyanobacterium]